MKRIVLSATAAVLSLGLSGVGAQDNLNGEQIMRHVDQDHRSDDERGQVQMVLVRGDDREARVMEIFTKTGEGDDDLSMLRFVEPANVRGTSVLTLEASGRSDDQWVYLPSLNRSRRIAASNRTERFAGTDYTFEDIRSEDFENHTYRRLDNQTVNGVDCMVVECTANDDYESGYSRRLVFVDSRYLTIKTEFYDRQGELHKVLAFRNYEQVDGHWRARESMMHDMQRDTRTVWRFAEREINPGLPDSLFTVRTLERGL